MIFKHKPLIDSSVMREFEKIAISKGMAKAEVFSKTASDETVDLSPSNDLIIDIINLAEGLRAKGFSKDAESLESKVLAYKKAETHLYRAIDEDAEDMLEFAHPKKNRVKFDAKDGHGEFEDTRTQHGKIVAIVNKKVANEYDVVLNKTAEILGLKKKADLDETGKKLELVKYYKNQLIKFSQEKNAYYTVHYQNSAFVRDGDSNELSIGTEDYEYLLIEGFSKTWDFPDKKEHVYESKFLDYFCNSNNIVDEKLNDLKNGDVSFKEIISPEDVNHANENLKNVYKTFFDKINSIPALTASSGNSEINSFINIVKSLFDENSWFIIKGLTNNDGTIENYIRSAAKKMEDSALSLLKLIQPKNVNSTVSGMDEIFDSGFANVVANRFEKCALVTNDKESDPTYFNAAAKIIRDSSDKPFSVVYNALKAFDPALAKLTDKHQVDSWIQAWQTHFKVASQNNLITKKAKGDAPETVPTSAPTQITTLPSQIRTRLNPKKNPQAVIKSNFEQSYPEEYTAVSNMQDAVHKLADSLPSLLKGTDPNSIDNIIGILKGTGYGEKGSRGVSTDGEWGPATQKALEAAQTILTKLNQKVNLTSAAQRNQGKATIDTKEIAKLATDNTNAIYSSLDALGVDVKDKIKEVDDNSPYVDSLPAKVDILGEVVATEDKTSGNDLTKNNLSSFNNLFNFLKLHELTETDGFNVKDWEKVIRWFYGRASQQLIETKKKSKGLYKALLENLFTKLQDYVGSHPNNNQLVSAKEIDGAMTGNVSLQKSNGPTQNASSNSNAEGVDEQGAQVDKYFPAPFGYKFDLTNLHDVYGPVMNSYNLSPSYANLLNDVTFDVRDFGYDVTSLATTYIKLSVQSILDINRLDPNGIVPNLKIQGKPITYSQLFTYFSTVPYVVNIKAKAYDQALYQVCSGLLNDLSNVMTYWKRNTKHTQQSSDLVDAAWKKWADALRATLGRINQDISSKGQAPALQGSY